MADNQTPKTTEDIEKELSVDNFAVQQLKTLALTFGGAAVGLGAGFGVAKAGMANFLKNRNWKWVEALGARAGSITSAITMAGGALGFMGGTIASGYEHWVKGRREQLGVQKVTNDIDMVMKSRIDFENTLGEQHNVVTSMRERLEGERGKISPDAIKEEKNKPAERTT